MLEIIRSDKLIGAAPARTAREPRGARTAGAVPLPAGEAVRWCDDFQLMMNTRPEYAPPGRTGCGTLCTPSRVYRKAPSRGRQGRNVEPRRRPSTPIYGVTAGGASDPVSSRGDLRVPPGPSDYGWLDAATCNVRCAGRCCNWK